MGEKRLSDFLIEFEDANVELADLEEEIRQRGGLPTREMARTRERIRRKIAEIADKIPDIISSKE